MRGSGVAASLQAPMAWAASSTTGRWTGQGRRPAEEMHGDDRLVAAPQAAAAARASRLKLSGFDVGEHWSGAEARDAAHAGERRKMGW